MAISLDSTIVAVPTQVSSNLGEETVILEIGTGVYFGLDAVGASIWRLLQEPRVVGRVLDALLDEYDVDVARCQTDLLRVLAELRAQGLITVSDGSAR